MDDDKAASALGSFRDANFRTSLAGNVRVEAGKSSDDLELRGRDIRRVRGR